MANIRLLEREDIPQVVALRRKCFARSDNSSDEALAAYIEEVFLKGPWSRQGTQAVVSESKDGRLVGFHGRFEKAMLIARKDAKLVTGTQLMVDPDAGGFAGIQLLQQLFRGDHDLFVADGGNEATRRMWEGLGADVVHVQSLTWILPLRPHYHLRHLGKSLAARAGRFAARRVLDLTTRRAGQDSGLSEPVTAEAMAPLVRELAGKKALIPVYQPSELRWIFDHIAQGGADQAPINRLVVGPKQRTLGWFSYQARPGNLGQVLGVVAQDDAYGAVLDALVADASARGCDGLQGRVELRYLDELGKRGCEIARSGPWLLVHSKRADVLAALHRGETKFTLLDGERWLRF